MPDVRMLERFAPVLLGASIGVAVLGGVLAPTLDDPAPPAPPAPPTATGERRFEEIGDQLPLASTTTTATAATPPAPAAPADPTATTAVPPADLASLLVDLSPRGFTSLPASEPFGPLADAEAAALMDSAEDGGQPSVETLVGLLRLAGFTRGHASVWDGGDVVAVTVVLEFADGDGATRYGGALAEILESDPVFDTTDAGLDGAHAATGRVLDDGSAVEVFQGHVVRSARLYRLVMIDTLGNPVDLELGRAVLADQAAVG